MRPTETYRWYLRNVYPSQDWIRPMEFRLIHPKLIRDSSERGEIHYELNGKARVVRVYDNRRLSPDPGRPFNNNKLNGDRNL